MQLKYKLIVSDFDGTLRRTEGGISEGNAEAIRRYVEAGGIFALCTGRMASSILPYARQLKLKGPVVSYQGAIVQDAESGAILRDLRLPWQDAADLCKFLEKFDYHIHVCEGDTFYVNKDDEALAAYERICAVHGTVPKEPLSALVEERHISPHKVLVMCEPEERDRALARLREKFGDRFYITTSTENLVEVVAVGSDKGGALRFLAEFYGIPLSDTIALGDNYNDLPMILAAGLGVAVENGEEELKRQADYVTRTCDEDGVGYVIRKFGLGEEV